MPHYKCEACKTRLHVPGGAAAAVGDLCPDCGSLLEPAAGPAELVGYRSITSRDDADLTPRSQAHRRIADLVDESIARRAARLERDGLDAERWLGDDDEPAAAAVALPHPAPHERHR